MKSAGLSVVLLVALSACSDGVPAESSQRRNPEPRVEQRAWQQIEAGALLLDVRTPAEYARGHLEGSVNIPYDELERRDAELGEDRDRPIVLYCRTGRRSRIAWRTLEDLGFTEVLDAGGYEPLRRARPAGAPRRQDTSR